MIEIWNSAVKRIYIVEFNHILHHVFHLALFLFVYYEGRSDLIDLLHKLNQLGRAQFYNFTEYNGYLAIICIENWLPLRSPFLYHIIEYFSFEFNWCWAIQESKADEPISIDSTFPILENWRIDEASDARVVPLEILPGRRGACLSQRFNRHSLAIASLIYFTCCCGKPYSLGKDVSVCARKGKT